MRGLVVVVLCASASACESRREDLRDAAQPVDAELSPPTTSALPPNQVITLNSRADRAVHDPSEPQAAPLLVSGVPAVSRGPVIRLESLEVGARMVGALEVPTVAIADLDSRAALDERLLRHAEFGRCTIMLALETFVALRCAEVDTRTGTKQYDHHIAHFEVGAGGAVAEVEVQTLFHASEADVNMTQRLVHDPGAGARRAVATEYGIELSYPFDGKDETDRLSWRAIAPYIRVDGPLGPALIAEGLPLAPAGTKLPLAPVSPALWAKSEQTLLRVWAAAPPRIRARARLATPGGHNPVGLVFAPDIAAGEVAQFEGKLIDRGLGFYTEMLPLVVAVRTREPVQLHEQPGLDRSVIDTVPESTVLTAVDGLVHGLDSAPGRASQWAYVVAPGGGAGWVMGASLELLGAVYEARSGTPN